MSFANVGKVWSLESFKSYVNSQKAPVWANKICFHHTGEPSLAQRPKGFTIKHIENIRDFYKNEKGWTKGPHFFIDEDQIFGMTPPNIQGIHAPSFNKNAIGIEVLGNFDYENPKVGRGIECWETAAKAGKILADWLNIPLNSTNVVFHRECPITQKTSKKSCPGKLVDKSWLLSLVDKKKDVVPLPNDALIKAERIMVPVAKYLQDTKKIPYSVISTKLKKVGVDYFYGDHLLEYAYYDTTKQTTYAPVTEIEEMFN